MRKFTAVALALFACSCLLATASAQKVVDIPVAVNDADTLNTLYRIRSDGRGIYKHSRTLQSII
jgi:hypothetical protein